MNKSYLLLWLDVLGNFNWKINAKNGNQSYKISNLVQKWKFWIQSEAQKAEFLKKLFLEQFLSFRLLKLDGLDMLQMLELRADLFHQYTLFVFNNGEDHDKNYAYTFFMLKNQVWWEKPLLKYKCFSNQNFLCLQGEIFCAMEESRPWEQNQNQYCSKIIRSTISLFIEHSE